MQRFPTPAPLPREFAPGRPRRHRRARRPRLPEPHRKRRVGYVSGDRPRLQGERRITRRASPPRPRRHPNFARRNGHR